MHLAHRFLTFPCSSILRILVLFMALAPTSMVWAPAPEVQRMKSSMSFFQNLYTLQRRSQIPALTTWMSRVDSHITKTLGDFATRLAEMEQNFSTFTARLCKVETFAASAKKYVNHSQPQGPMAQDHLMTIGIRDADLIFPQALLMNMREVPSYYVFPCEQHHKGITKWIDNLWEESNMPACNKPVRIHCKAGSVSVRLVFETRGKCQDFVAR